MHQPLSEMLLLAVTILAQAAEALQTGGCNYRLEDWYLGESSCILPTYTATAEFAFTPLFPGKVKFVYAADAIDGARHKDLDPLYDANKVRDWHSSLVGYWLEYDGVSLNNSPALAVQTEMVVYYTDVTKDVGGGLNGCEQLLGAQCVGQINASLASLFVSLPTYQRPLAQLGANTKNVTACPAGMFAEAQFLDPRVGTLNTGTFQDSELLATEFPTNGSHFDSISRNDALPSGNASFTYARQLYELRPIATQQGMTAVAILMRYPLRQGETNQGVPTTAADINVAVACAKLPAPSGGAGGGRPPNAGGRLVVDWPSLVVTILAAVVSGGVLG